MTQEQTEQQVWQELATMMVACPCTYLGPDEDYCAGCEMVNATDGHDIGDCTCASCTHCHGSGRVPRFEWAQMECKHPNPAPAGVRGNIIDRGDINPHYQCRKCRATRRILRPWSAKMALAVRRELLERYKAACYVRRDHDVRLNLYRNLGQERPTDWASGATPELAELRALVALAKGE